MFELAAALVVIVVSYILKTMKNVKSRQAVDAHRVAASKTIEQSQHIYAPVQETILPAMSPADVPGQVIAPTVHAHIVPDCVTHDAPGSLGVASMEGKDPCHEDELTLERTLAEPEEPQGGLTLDWSGENMVKAFVMQEVLTRPINRRRA